VDGRYRWYWRRYRTASGADPVAEFLAGVGIQDRRAILGAMNELRLEGPRAARHLRGDVYEVRVRTATGQFRVLFSQESRTVLLALLGYAKHSQRIPRQVLELAERRLRDWRDRGLTPKILSV
jgi:phage-related protein